MLGREKILINLNKSSIFKTELGEKLYEKVYDYVKELNLSDAFTNGVLVGFSGGADSLFLLEFLNEYKNREALDFKILAVHVNHSIRGEEADFDEELSREYANSRGIEFISERVDAKAYANENKLCLEEAARNLRYSVFREIIQGRNDVSTIAIAHNANDNFETVLFNMMRGTGLRGISGIAPVRENIIRPILKITKSEIIELLSENNIKYACDSTNLSTEYTRNYIRHELIPKFSRLSENPYEMVSRLSDSLRSDNGFIEDCAENFYSQNSRDGKIQVEKLSSLHTALKSRVISHLAKREGISLERVHISKIIELLPSGNFSVSLPSGYDFISEGGEAFVAMHTEYEEFSFKLEWGLNTFEGFDDVIIVSDTKIDETSLNVYKISIQASFDFDIISDGAYVRSKKDGDSYRAGGMTRKLKKLFNDKNVPPSKRANVPVICDKNGILLVPGFRTRDGAYGKKVYLAICSPRESSLSEKRSFYIIK